MQSIIREQRHRARVSLRQLSNVLGLGYSPAFLCLVERGLAQISGERETIVLEAIRRLAPLCEAQRRVIEIARALDFGPTLAKLRVEEVIPNGIDS